MSTRPDLPQPACISNEDGFTFQNFCNFADANTWADYFQKEDAELDYRVEPKGVCFRVVAYEHDGYRVGPL